MKKVYILVVILSITVGIKAQSYIRMLDTTNVWSVYCGGITTNNEDFRQTDKLLFIGDTIVHDTLYRKLFARVYTTPTDSALHYLCALREDTALRKVFKRNNPAMPTAEELLYDFSLSPGDSLVLSLDFYNHPSPVKVDSVASKYFAAYNRKVMYIKSFYQLAGSWYSTNIEWIEGIGKVNAMGKLIGPIDEFETKVNELLCFSNSNQMLYQNTTYNTCLIIHVGIDEVKKITDFSIYPNPTREYLEVEMPQITTEVRLIISDAAGNEILSRTIYNQKTRIDLKDFAKGMYFVKIVSTEGVSIQKIIKE